MNNNKNHPKTDEIKLMFNDIAPKYDFLNRFLSLGVDIYWRRKAINKLRKTNPKTILDIATGTGDFAIESLKLNPDKIIGIDISTEMLKVGKEKINNKNYNNIIELKEGNAENINFNDCYFDATTVAFGVRNFENLEKGIKEIIRVLKPNGTLIILEFADSNNSIIRKLFNLYFNKILPVIGKLFSKNNIAYTYLPESVKKFYKPEDFKEVLVNCGFSNVEITKMTFNLAIIYECKK